MIKKHLPILVLVAAVFQVAVAYFFATQGFFNEEDSLVLFIQPAGYAFSIWGLIFTFASLYAVYQAIPSNDNVVLRQNRKHALVLFLGAGAWLYASNLPLVWLWITVPILLLMGYVSYKTVTVSKIDIGNTTITSSQFFSQQCLIVYAAWTNIAMFVNIGAMAVQYNLFESGTVWLGINIVLLLIVFLWTYVQFKKLRYSFWYGFITTWALIGVFVANGRAEGNMFVAYMAAVLTIPFVLLSINRLWSIISSYSITIESK